MNVIVLVKHGAGGSTPSLATRYIARRERDVEREGAAPRKLFSEKEDQLGSFQANRYLGKGEDPEAKDLLHLVISLEKEADFIRLDSNEEARQLSMRKAMRATMKQMAADLQADELRWVAGIHRNTNNPHVHLLIHRNYIHRETGRERRLKTLPLAMRVHWEKDANGNRRTHPGSLSQSFGMSLEKQVERGHSSEGLQRSASPISMRERMLLGNALIAEEKIAELRKKRDENLFFGDRFRFEFTNGRSEGRGFSEQDIQQRGWARAQLAMNAQTERLSPEQRREQRQLLFLSEYDRHEELLQKHREARTADLTRIELKLARAEEASGHLIAKAEEIYRQHDLRPTPYLPQSTLSKLQERAIDRGERDKAARLEEIRTALAAENQSPARSVTEVSRLKAQLFVAEIRLLAETESAQRFEETKHLLRWELPGSTPAEPSKKSLAEIERSLVWEEDQSKFIGTRRLHWNEDRRELADVRMKEMSLQRQFVLAQIETRRTDHSAEISRQTDLITLLSEINSREEREFESSGREVPELVFTKEEIKELDAIASRLQSSEVYRSLVQLERKQDEQCGPGIHSSIDERAVRAMARAVIAEISLRAAHLSLERFREQQEFTDVIVRDGNADEIQIARLADLPSPPLERLLAPLIGPDERRQEIEAALESHGQRLRDAYERASATHAFLRDEARNRKEEFTRRYGDALMPAPQFTYREISQLELHAARETDPAFKSKYEGLYQHAIKNPLEDRPRKILIERNADELLAPIGRDDFASGRASRPTTEISDSRSEMSLER